MQACSWAYQINALCAARPGAIEPSPGTYPHLVLVHLRASRGHPMRQCEIRQSLGIGHPAAVWALLKLRRLGLVEGSRDDTRNGRYMRYRAV
jgi:DNA-binding transcriptional ArsR family regulator